VTAALGSGPEKQAQIVFTGQHVKGLESQRSPGKLGDPGVITPYRLAAPVVAAEWVFAANMPDDIVGQLTLQMFEIACRHGIENASSLLNMCSFHFCRSSPFTCSQTLLTQIEA
jgi:hypothetical protein